MSYPPHKLTSISVFLPCYNEAQNISLVVSDFLAVLPQISHRYEIIIINDGSIDQTKKMASQIAKKHPQVKVVNHLKNLGYGAAVQSGIKASGYEWIFFTDGDHQFDVKELVTFVPYSRDYQVIIGYRHKRADGWLRSFNARVFKLFINILYRLHVKDIDCAFKLFHQSAIKPLTLQSDGAMISTEILYRLKKKHVRFKQLPVNHFPRKFGQPTGNNLKVVIKAGIEAFSLYYQLKFKTKYS
jgi:glycosyltransferase involved in cell wall biosynthesis